MFRSVGKALRLVVRAAGSLVGWLWTLLVLEPAEIRGWPWTMGLWLSALGGAGLLSVPAAWPFLTLFAAGWLLRWQANRRPKRPARELPYLRRR
jgi:hypothetical protein